ncbi:hypothetical protein HYC85_025562 [Camellia sinensis]|uniref:Terpene synthase N-terminal domain-containing protein n=1 Tax=Camellia sinensis TaxID=4442 RepID=A0A7J7GFC8_CAMSI|nr:hypothetical protein HYC85_025562 [Camellia sinensis]
MALALLKLVVPTSSLYTSTRIPSQSCASSQSAASIDHGRALRTIRCISLSQTCDLTIVRRTANYKPPIWDYDSLQSLNNIYVKGAEKLKEEVKRMLAEVVDPLGGLEMIDDLQRLGVFYHFEDEIKRVLDNIRNDDKWNNKDLHSTALQFRLLRQHGFNIPQGTSMIPLTLFFIRQNKRFIDEKGKDTTDLINVNLPTKDNNFLFQRDNLFRTLSITGCHFLLGLAPKGRPKYTIGNF